MHEVGHSYTLTHTPTGIMSRGYNHWNRTFVAKEPGRQGAIPPQDEEGSHWHRLDIMRLRYHPGFRTLRDGPKGCIVEPSPSFIPLEDGHFLVDAPAGLSMLEINVNGRYRTHYEFLQENPKTMKFSIKDICDSCKCKPTEKISLEAICINQRNKHVENVAEFLNAHGVRLPGVEGTVIKSDIFGSGSEGATKSTSVFLKENQFRQPIGITVHHGSFLDGFIIHWADGNRDVVGRQGGGKSHFDIAAGERIESLIVGCGGWIDGIQFKLTSGRKSPWYGGKGGSPVAVRAPQGYEMVGVYSTATDWMEQIGIFYRRALN